VCAPPGREPPGIFGKPASLSQGLVWGYLQRLPLAAKYRAVAYLTTDPTGVAHRELAQRSLMTPKQALDAQSHLRALFAAAGTRHLPIAILHETVLWVMHDRAPPTLPWIDPVPRSVPAPLLRAALAARGLSRLELEVAELLMERPPPIVRTIPSLLDASVRTVTGARYALGVRFGAANPSLVPLLLLHRVLEHASALKAQDHASIRCQVPPATPTLEEGVTRRTSRPDSAGPC